MKRVLTGEMMKKADLLAQEALGIDGLVLMERAALGAREVLFDEGFDTGRVLIVCGTGNNGGDGLALARLLLEKDIKPDIFICTASSGSAYHGTGAFERQLASLKALKAEFLTQLVPERNYTTVVDALFGISLSRDVEGEYAKAVRYINEQRKGGAKILSLDMPSGVHSDSGCVMGEAVMADVTVTFGFYKTGQILYPGALNCGKLILKPIGIFDSSLEMGKNREYTRMFVMEDKEVVAPGRPAYSNKGTFGKVLLIAGSEEICGAAILSGMAAMRAGAGMLKIITHDKNREVINRVFPEAMLMTWSSASDITDEQLDQALSWCSVAAIGPGIGKGEMAVRLTEYMVRQDLVPVVFDADALNIIAEKTDLLYDHPQDMILTPHVGEMSRLTGLGASEVASHLIDTAIDFSGSYGVITVLKDARTVICDPAGVCVINTKGNSGMATAGSGDVLTGIIAALVGMGIMKPFRAAALGVALHAKAGDEGAKELGEESLLARDIIKYYE